MVIQKIGKTHPYIKNIKEMESSKSGSAWWPKAGKDFFGFRCYGVSGNKSTPTEDGEL